MAPLFTKRGNRQARRFFKKEGRKAKNFFTKTVPEIYDKVDKGAKQTLSFLEKNADEIGLALGAAGAIATGDPTMVQKGAQAGQQASQMAGEANKARGQLRKDLNQAGKDIARSARESRQGLEAPSMSRGAVFSGVRQGLGDYGRSVLAEQERANMFME